MEYNVKTHSVNILHRSVYLKNDCGQIKIGIKCFVHGCIDFYLKYLA